AIPTWESTLITWPSNPALARYAAEAPDRSSKGCDQYSIHFGQRMDGTPRIERRVRVHRSKRRVPSGRESTDAIEAYAKAKLTDNNTKHEPIMIASERRHANEIQPATDVVLSCLRYIFTPRRFDA